MVRIPTKVPTKRKVSPVWMALKGLLDLKRRMALTGAVGYMEPTDSLQVALWEAAGYMGGTDKPNGIKALRPLRVPMRGGTPSDW